MGTRNKERRAAKARRRLRDQARRPGDAHDGGGRRQQGRHRDAGFRSSDHVAGLLELATWALVGDDGRQLAAALDGLCDAKERLVARETEAVLRRSVAAVWRRGWQPSEIVRHARRADPRAGRLMARAVAADHLDRHDSTLHPRWAGQVQALGIARTDAEAGWLTRFAEMEALDRRGLVAAAVAALVAVRFAGPLEIILPPPGQAVAADPPADGARVDDPVLAKVRALLAQAESTTFEAEAAAFTAKAQELMARHAIDAARVWDHDQRAERPTSIRLPVDDPYADIKTHLLQCVAGHSRCRAVHDGTHALSTVVGFESDLAATEVLYTSLLVQSQAFLRAEAAKAPPGGRQRSRSFRSSFLMSFARRIDERLREITADVQASVAAADDGDGALLPVLAARTDAVDQAVEALFGELVTTSVRGGRDTYGWACGRLAADEARLNAGDVEAYRRPATTVPPELTFPA